MPRSPSRAGAGSTVARGYGGEHQRKRKDALARMRDGDCCARCGQPMYRTQELHLDHADGDRSRYLGLSHAACNLSAGGRRSGHSRRESDVKPNPSRLW